MRGKRVLVTGVSAGVGVETRALGVDAAFIDQESDETVHGGIVGAANESRRRKPRRLHQSPKSRHQAKGADCLGDESAAEPAATPAAIVATPFLDSSRLAPRTASNSGIIWAHASPSPGARKFPTSHKSSARSLPRHHDRQDFCPCYVAAHAAPFRLSPTTWRLSHASARHARLDRFAPSRLGLIR
jgi:hypothetical protein